MIPRPLIEIMQLFRELGAEFLASYVPLDPAAQIRELNHQIFQCHKCGLHKSKTHYVPGEGAMRPQVMFIGEGPGETEDKFGRPFIGKAGQLLDRLIQKMGFSRETVFIGNIVKCRPPNNREPQKDEADSCLPFLQRQIEILRPGAIVCLGKVAYSHLVGGSSGISQVRGRRFEYAGVPVVPTYHPSYILHKKDAREVSQAKWEMWEDMQKVLAILGKKIAG